MKRPFTIDSWDFAYDADVTDRTSDDRRINPDSPMSIMHGDNSGVYQAMLQLAWFNRRLQNEEKALMWEEKAEQIKYNMLKYLWNGKFFIHQLHLNHNGADNLENERLSLSNPYDINRGVTDLNQSRSIIKEYIKRRQTTDKFAEWFSIDPPYKNFIGYKDGEYVNGSISPFTAGELAKAAFNNGYEKYGWEIISRFIELVKRDNDVYFLYYPDSTPQPDGGPSAWGSAALLSAIDEGLACIKNNAVGYEKIEFSPKFPVTHYTELRYITGYELTNTMVDVRYILKESGMRYDVYSPAKTISAHILLPDDKNCSKLLINSQESEYKISLIGDSYYVDFCINNIGSGYVSLEIIF